MGHCNPGLYFPINMCGHHGSSNQNNHELPTHLGLHLIRCCADKTSSSHSSTCICGRAGLRNCHPQRSSTWRGRIRFLEAIFMTGRSLLQVLHHACLPLCQTQTSTEGRRLQCELHHADRRLHPTIVNEPQVTNGSFSQNMSYILNMLIYIGIILLDNLLQCLLFIALIDLSRTCGNTATLIYNALVMFLIYPWIKIK
jgi:hypothetical protein